jgi:phosphoribosyl-AMP cyclohydrolase / phosphoribosyl-ATP pyrophosphohydrolase
LTLDPAAVSWDENGLAPAVVQDADTGRVLMLGWMNREALEATQLSRRVTFWSRSRQEMWEKGATSGHHLDLVSIEADCDADTLLVTTRPAGPTCHTGTATCWGDQPGPAFALLEDLHRVIEARARTRPAGSYTVTLLDSGPEGVGRKVVEEATEVLLAAKDHAAGTADDERVAEEAADLIYHLLVLLAERGIGVEDVADVLTNRRG